MKTTVKLIIYTLTLGALVITALYVTGVIQLQEILVKKDLANEKNRKTVTIETASEENTEIEITEEPVNSEAEETQDTRVTQKFTGIIKKEMIPEDLDLGEYWYWLYLDTPFILENNAMGKPYDIQKIQIVPAEGSSIDFEEFLDRKVEASGNIGWGYAESNIFNCVSVVFIN